MSMTSQWQDCAILRVRSYTPTFGKYSLRIDIPENDAPEENQRRDGIGYFEGGDDRFSDRRPADKLLNEIFASPANRFRYIRPK
jgi:hypothetical protein